MRMERPVRLRLSLVDNTWTSRLVLLAAAVVLGGAGGILAAGTKPLFVFGAIIGLLVALAIVLDTQVGLIAFLALALLLPFGVIPLPLGPVKLTFIDATLTLLLLVWLLRLLAKPGERLRTSRRSEEHT